jgi:hypothetical protein
MTPFPEEEAVMMIYSSPPPPGGGGGEGVPNSLQLGTQTETCQAKRDPLSTQILALLWIGTVDSGTQRY